MVVALSSARSFTFCKPLVRRLALGVHAKVIALDRAQVLLAHETVEVVPDAPHVAPARAQLLL